MNESNITIYAVYKPSNVITIEKFGSWCKYYALALRKIISYLWGRIGITANSRYFNQSIAKQRIEIALARTLLIAPSALSLVSYLRSNIIWMLLFSLVITILTTLRFCVADNSCGNNDEVFYHGLYLFRKSK